MEMLSKTKCLRCNGEMVSFGVEKIQLGQTGWLLGVLPNLISGALEVEIYICKSCGKIEFYYTEEENDIAQVTCPNCGRMHDLDFPKCPFCNYRY